MDSLSGDLEHSIVGMYALDDFYRHILARLGLGHRFVLNLQRRNFLFEIRGMAEEMHLIADVEFIGEVENGDADVVEVVGYCTNASARHLPPPFGVRPRSEERRVGKECR